jgi:hypothetical protein
MHPPDAPHICRACAVPHIDNCRDCSGFGVYAALSLAYTTEKPMPVWVAEALGGPSMQLGPILPCPTCKSTVTGLPDSLKPRAA